MTDAGREALASEGSCPCEIRLIGVLVQCTLCSTVYGHLREQKMPTFRRMRGGGRR